MLKRGEIASCLRQFAMTREKVIKDRVRQSKQSISGLTGKSVSPLTRFYLTAERENIIISQSD